MSLEIEFHRAGITFSELRKGLSEFPQFTFLQSLQFRDLQDGKTHPLEENVVLDCGQTWIVLNEMENWGVSLTSVQLTDIQGDPTERVTVISVGMSREPEEFLLAAILAVIGAADAELPIHDDSGYWFEGNSCPRDRLMRAVVHHGFRLKEALPL